MRAKATIRLNVLSRKLLGILSIALRPEVESAPTRRCKAELSEEGQSLVLKLEAQDSTSLRALVNSYLFLTLSAYEAIAKVQAIEEL